MPEKDFTRWLNVGVVYAWRDTREGETTAFRVVFLAEIEGTRYCVTRYDTAHGYAHRDIMGRIEGLRGKLPCPTVSYSQAFHYAIRDIEQNAEIYLADFLAH